MSCEICPIISDPSRDERALRILEGEYWRATLRRDQSLLGTTFITAKRHVESLAELSTDEWQEFTSFNTQVELAIKRAFGAHVINTSCLMNHAFKDESPQPHVHWHLKPRYSSAVTFNSQTFTDPAFGNYLSGDHPRLIVSQDLATAITHAIIEKL